MPLYLLTTHEVSTMALLDQLTEKSSSWERTWCGQRWGFQGLVTSSWMLCLNNRANVPMPAGASQPHLAEGTRTAHKDTCSFGLSVLTVPICVLPSHSCQVLSTFMLPFCPCKDEVMHEPPQMCVLGQIPVHISYSTASIPVNGLQPKEQTLGCFSENDRSCPLPQSLSI